jgi:hypothetical protein
MWFKKIVQNSADHMGELERDQVKDLLLSISVMTG